MSKSLFPGCSAAVSCAVASCWFVWTGSSILSLTTASGRSSCEISTSFFISMSKGTSMSKALSCVSVCCDCVFTTSDCATTFCGSPTATSSSAVGLCKASSNPRSACSGAAFSGAFSFVSKSVFPGAGCSAALSCASAFVRWFVSLGSANLALAFEFTFCSSNCTTLFILPISGCGAFWSVLVSAGSLMSMSKGCFRDAALLCISVPSIPVPTRSFCDLFLVASFSSLFLLVSFSRSVFSCCPSFFCFPAALLCL